ncbi:HEPN domain-containing protein [Acinetobacter shaoyimingii]|uniref:Uncharacterized protein n=1 Tax=Acinetobacter shaoyimingii TaxID=2715164 RepID=A0A6G8RTA1_9GAMM|nr:HEPN domain-containing protein [Acinetobacter shaoyimingii]NHB56483.1 hypothetical protein [Acinetobacter shaoyimingii]QIO05018.1 hypothetical protein G8E00_03035 [Acinetobacter shaoyimingii]
MMVLEEIFKHNKNRNSDRFNLRIHRGLSWFKKAILLHDDSDLQFISLMIAFNAIYAEETEDMIRDQHSLKVFLNRIYHQDYEKKFYETLCGENAQTIQMFLESPYLYQGYWDYKNQKINQMTWKQSFENEQIRILQAFRNKDACDILLMIFDRLFTLRSQMIHGGVSYKSSMNRKQLEDGCRILSSLMPTFIQVLIENAEMMDVDKPYYPVVQMS